MVGFPTLKRWAIVEKSLRDSRSAALAEVLLGEERLRRMVAVWLGLIKANLDYRLHEGE
jgi:hypothetical protein